VSSPRWPIRRRRPLTVRSECISNTGGISLLPRNSGDRQERASLHQQRGREAPVRLRRAAPERRPPAEQSTSSPPLLSSPLPEASPGKARSARRRRGSKVAALLGFRRQRPICSSRRCSDMAGWWWETKTRARRGSAMADGSAVVARLQERHPCGLDLGPRWAGRATTVVCGGARWRFPASS
jgi:hypothetical protein